MVALHLECLGQIDQKGNDNDNVIDYGRESLIV